MGCVNMVNVFFVCVAFAERLESRSPKYFEAIIPKRLRNLPGRFEEAFGAVLRCPGSMDAIVYGVSTAFQLDGAVKCKADPDLKYTECEIPLKIAWLRALSVTVNSDETFFKTVHESVTYREDIGITEKQFEEVFGKLFEGKAVSDSEDERGPFVDLRALRECVREAFGNLSRMFSSLVSKQQAPNGYNHSTG